MVEQLVVNFLQDSSSGVDMTKADFPRNGTAFDRGSYPETQDTLTTTGNLALWFLKDANQVSLT